MIRNILVTISMGLATCTLALADSPIIKVIIIAVPSNSGVELYKKRDLGKEFVQACADLTALFTKDSLKDLVEVEPLCDEAHTRSDYVNNELDKYFGGPQRGRLTIVFLMGHGEPSKKLPGAIVLMSDATDQDKEDKSIKLRHLADLMTAAADSVTLGFVDACFSGSAKTSRLTGLGEGAWHQGTHVGLLASAHRDQESLAAAFTKALIKILPSNTCSPRLDLFTSALTREVKNATNSDTQPQWLILFHDSPCLNDLLDPKKRIVSFWRDPELQEGYSIDLYDKTPKPIATILDDKEIFANPYLMTVSPGTYWIQAHRKVDTGSGKEEKIDRQTCDFGSVPFCMFFYPPSAKTTSNTLDSLSSIYASAVAHRLPGAETEVADEAVDLLAKLTVENPTEARIKATRFETDPSTVSFWGSVRASPTLKKQTIVVTGRVDAEKHLQKAYEEYTQINPIVRIQGTPLSDELEWRTDIYTTLSPGNKINGIPIALNAVVPIYHVPGVTNPIRFTRGVLSKIYSGQIRKWNDPALAESNPGIALPDLPIVPVNRVDPSGASYVFAKFLAQVDGRWNILIKEDHERYFVAWPTGVSAVGNFGVDRAVQELKGSIGYVELSYTVKNERLGFLERFLGRDQQLGLVENFNGTFVNANAESIVAAEEPIIHEVVQCTTVLPVGFSCKTTPLAMPDPRGYPLAGEVFLSIPPTQGNSTAARIALDFAKWFIEGDKTKDAGWIPLPPDIARQTLTELNQQIRTQR